MNKEGFNIALEQLRNPGRPFMYTYKKGAKEQKKANESATSELRAS